MDKNAFFDSIRGQMIISCQAVKGEPLYEDVCSVILESGRNIKVLACRYGLASKDYTPDQVIAQFDNMKAA